MTAQSSVEIVRLGARCDVAHSGTGTGPVWRAQFTVEEFADLSDGRRVPLRYGGAGGFGMQLNSGARTLQATVWSSLTAETLEADVRTVVLPDVDDGEDHPWEALQRAISDASGVEITTDELKRIPYVVEFSDAVLAKLPASAEA